MKAFRFPVSLAGFLFSSVVVPAIQPYIPGDDAVVLVRLPPSSSLHHRSPTPTVTSLPEALVEARELVREARRSGDPRLLGRAQSILRPWWTEINAPVDALLLRAEIKQGLHDFRSALEDLNAALRHEPRHAGAWLLKTTLHQVLGDRAEAQRSCLQLARHADDLTTTAAAASLRSQTDPDSNPAETLAAAIRRHPDAPVETLAWAWTTLGEIQARNGDRGPAEQSFRAALQLEPRSPYTLTALADLWLESGASGKVVERLRDTTSEPLRLRLAEALLRLEPDAPATRHLVADLAVAFALAQVRADELHLREFARFVLRIQKEPALAVTLARRNWSIQKEPADLDLLIEAAAAAGDTETLVQVRQWAEQHHVAMKRRTDSRADLLSSPNSTAP